MTNRAMSAIAAMLFALAIADAPAGAQPGAVHVPVPVLERYLGVWVYPDGETVTLTRSGDTLFRQVPGQRVPYVALSETLFRLGPVFTAEFVSDNAGGITQVLTDGTVEYRLRKKGAPPPPPAPPEKLANVPRAVLERYAGVYEYIPGQMRRTDLRIVVRLKGDTLIRDVEQPQILLPLSETRFRVAGSSLIVEFVVDDAGVTQILGTGGQQMLARLTKKH